MSPDLEKYRRIAEENGEECAFGDAELLRLWAALEHLFERSVTETCPQLLADKPAMAITQSPSNQLSSTDRTNSKEASP